MKEMNKMATIKKTPGGSYCASIVIGKTPEGKQILKYVTAENAAKCKKKAREVEEQLKKKPSSR